MEDVESRRLQAGHNDTGRLRPRGGVTQLLLLLRERERGGGERGVCVEGGGGGRERGRERERYHMCSGFSHQWPWCHLPLCAGAGLSLCQLTSREDYTG